MRVEEIARKGVVALPVLRQLQCSSQAHRGVFEIHYRTGVRMVRARWQIRKAAVCQQPQGGVQTGIFVAGLGQYLIGLMQSLHYRRATAAANWGDPVFIDASGFAWRLQHADIAATKPNHAQVRSLAVNLLRPLLQQTFRQRQIAARQHGCRTIQHQAMQRTGAGLAALVAQVMMCEWLIAFLRQSARPMNGAARRATARTRLL